jgi:hypothetical protein
LRTQGTNRRWRIAGLCLLASIAALALAQSALAARAHEFQSTFGELCSAEPCEGAALKEPDGVAVNEASGDIYVVDEGQAGTGGRVVRFDEGGSFQSEFTGPSATGTGDLSEGSTTIESALASTGAFSVNEEVTGEGIPPETKITQVEGTTLQISNPVEAGKSGVGVELKAQQRFEAPEEIAVDNSCVLQKLSQAECEAGEKADPSDGDVYVVDAGREHEHGLVDKFSASGEYLGQIREGGGIQFFKRAIDGVAVDASGTLWIYREEPAQVDRFSDANPNVFIAPEISLIRPGGGFATPGGFAADAKGDFYGTLLVNSAPQVTKWNHTGEVLIQSLDGEGSTSVSLEQTNDTALVDAGTSIGVFSPEGAPIERLGQEKGAEHLKAGAGIGVNAAAGFLYVADSQAGPVVVFGPAQPATPKIEGESFAKVSESAVSLSAEINPRSEAGEAPTEYRFQYGRCATPSSCAQSGYESETSAGQIQADFEVHSVTAKLEGLQPDTTYHFRALARNSHGEGAPGGEETFTTQGEGGALTLADNRAWELVSPPDKRGALIAPIAESGVVQASASGEGITYLANTPTESQPQGYTSKVQILSRRGADSWSSRDVAIPHAAATGQPFGVGPEYKFFTPALTDSAVQSFGQFDPQLSEEASESTAYLHDLSESCASSCYRPLVTGKPGFANVPEGTVFGEAELCEPRPGEGTNVVCGPEFIGASSNLSHVVLKANAALTPGAALGALYEWAGGALAPVSVLPGASSASQALGLGGEAARGAISADGARIAWEASETLYERDTARGETVQLDAAQAPGGEGLKEKEEREERSGGGLFQVGSADGSRVLLTDTHALSEDTGATTGKPDLYECKLAIVASKLSCQLSDLTPKRGEEAAEVQGSVLGASEDATTVYFVARGVQSEAANARGQKATPGQPNLYVRRGGASEFISTLSAEDEHDWGAPSAGTPTRVSPNGRYLEFMSEARPTGYDNRDRASGKPVAEVYLYDAQSKRLSCASCEPSGARPVGVEYFKLEPGSGGLAGGPRGVWLKEGLVAGIVPGWTQIRSAGPAEARYQPPYLTDSGRLFFNSADALVPQDANGTEDVYEYEPPGLGSCSEASPTYSARSGGCVSLISSGSSTQESAFMGASESGDDVFFLTSSRLSPLDVDTALDVYDAHVCTSAEPCIGFTEAQAPCQSEASCRPSPSPQPQIFGAPTSQTLSGPPNPPAPAPVKAKVKTPAEVRAEKLAKALKGCRAKKNKHKRKACEASARKRYGAKAKHKAKAEKHKGKK